MSHSIPESRRFSLYALIVVVVFTGLLSSCITTKKITYLQEHEKLTDTTVVKHQQPGHYRIMVNDNIFIRVSTPDPRWSAMFNTLPVQSGIAVTEQTVDLISYRVQQDSTIAIPFVGAISVVGMTIPEITSVVEVALSDYITDADITVKLVNNYVSILGEVNRPGRYLIYKEFMNIFEALALAGDLADYSNRYNIQVIRQTEDGTVINQFDITDKDIIDTEFYYVIPNDVIYAQPMKGKFFNMTAFPYALILSTLTTFILLMNLIGTTTPK